MKLSHFYTVLDYNNLELLEIFVTRELANDFRKKRNEEWLKTIPKKIAEQNPFRFETLPLDKAIDEIKEQLELRSDYADDKR